MTEHNFRFDIDEFVEHQQHREFTFELPASSIGRRSRFEALCRRLTIMDRASLGSLPDHLQNEVWTQLKAASREIQKLQDQGKEPESITEALANNDKMLNLANLFCKYGWITPRIVTDPREEDLSKGVLHVDRIKAEDRIAYMWACNDATSEAAKRFELFRPGPAESVPGGQTGAVPAQGTGGPAGHPEPPIVFGTQVPNQ